jgi:hypothetical protein
VAADCSTSICKSSRFDDIGGLRGINEVCATLACDCSGELGVGSGFRNFVPDDRPCCFGAVVALDVLREVDASGGTAQGSLDYGEELIEGDIANGTLEIGKKFSNT